MHAVAEKTVPAPATAWHCCLEFFSVATRLPRGVQARTGWMPRTWCRRKFSARMTVHDLPAGDCLEFLQNGRPGRHAGRAIYDAHIAEVARAAGAKVVITDNRRHFLAALRYGIRVETPTEFLAALKARRK